LQNSVQKVFIAQPIDMLYSNFVKFGLQEIREILLCLLDKKISPGFPVLSSTARMAPKIRQGQPPTMYPEFSRFYPNRFTFGGVIAERVNTAKTRRRDYSESSIRLKPIFERNNESASVAR